MTATRERFWKRKLERERFQLPVSRGFARHVFYAGCFIYASFWIHGQVIYRGAADAQAPEAIVVHDEKPLERDALEPVLERVLGVARRPR